MISIDCKTINISQTLLLGRFQNAEETLFQH